MAMLGADHLRIGGTILKSLFSLLVLLVQPTATSAFEAVPCNATTVDCGLQFFTEVYQLFQSVEKEVIIMPFFIRPKLKVFASQVGHPPDTTLEDLIVQAVNRQVHVWILGWDNAASEKLLNYHQDHIFEEIFKAAGSNHEYLHLMLDTGRRLMASVYYLPHIKSYAFDRKVAYVGGLDFAENRLDSPQHMRPDSRLVGVNQDADHMTGNEKPWQDVMVRVDGAAAVQVAMVGIERWWTYCKSSGYLRAQAMRPMSAVADALLKVGNSLSVSQWKSYQCDHHPEPAQLGSLSVSVSGGPIGGSVPATYLVEAFPPPVQSTGLPRNHLHRQVSLRSGEHVEVPIRGLRGLDKQLPSTLQFEVDTVPYTAHSDRDITVTAAGGAQLIVRWMPHGVFPAPAMATQREQTCQVVLSGDRMWMGTERIVKDSLEQHIKIIREAKNFIFIENQYFSTDFPSSSFTCQNSNIRGEAVLYSGATNRIGEVLLDRIKRAGRENTDFNVAIIIPLGTEPGSFYPNLRSTYCFEEAVEHYWKEKDLKSNWRDYFSFFFIANVVRAPQNMGGPGSAFYGIFTHTKMITADDDVALVGSANINDRSMNGDRDAEVGVLVRGGSFPKRFRETLLEGHLGNSSLADPQRFLASLRRVADANAAALKASMGISFPEGTITTNKGTRQLFGMKGVHLLNVVHEDETQNVEIEYPDSRVVAGGGGVDTFKWYVVKGAEPPPIKGLLFPWSRLIWGLPKMTHVGQMLSNELSWMEIPDQNQDEIPAGHWSDDWEKQTDKPLLL